MEVKDLLRMSELQHRDHAGRVVLTRNADGYEVTAFMDGEMAFGAFCSLADGERDHGAGLFYAAVEQLEEELGPMA